MTDNSNPSVQIPKADVLALIFQLFPWSQRFEYAPVRDYAAALFDAVPQKAPSESRAHGTSVLESWVGQTARRRGFEDTVAAAFEREISSFPVMQMGPHLHLLIEPDAFYTHLFSIMGLSALGRRAYLSYACSTVKFVERGRKGPGWLKIQGQSINTFGLSRSRMIPYSVLAANDQYAFQLINVDNPGHEPEMLARLRGILPSGQFSSAAEAIKSGNDCLWRHIFDQKLNFMQVDDTDVVHLLIAHLNDDNSWIKRRLFKDCSLACEIIAAIEQLNDTPWRGWLRNTTHFFWGCRDGQLFPLWLQGGALRSCGKHELTVDYSPSSIVDALVAGRIIPNLLLMFIATTMIPGVRSLGGSRHTIYYPLMRHAVCTALRQSGKEEDLLADMVAERLPSAWGHRVVLDESEPLSLLESCGGVTALVRRFGGMTISGASGSLSGFTEDILWSQLFRASGLGEASLSSLQGCGFGT
ncbi:hypothetical protein [Rhizobium leguminosarum]|uniref:hypothetical protein n=1 Tax=Rhizobium leguminosarum TaxID=384 RepID=UPI001C944BC1|nr:hypothetical protein [Rhizobium leguminosarum]MBY5827761.1 hypothetical protein [Rhizobium leguminosarum]